MSSHRSGSQAGGPRSGSQGGGSRAGSNRGDSPSRSRQGSPSKGPSGYPTPLGYDPGRDPTSEAKDRMNKNIDLPPEAYAKGMEHPFARRPAFNKSGQEIGVFVNQFRVMAAQTREIYQYDVAVTPDVGSPALIREAIWSQKAQADRQRLCGNWILDDRKLAWCTKKIDNPITTKVDMDVERGRKARRTGSSDFYVTIRFAKTLRLEVLPAYLREKMGFDNSVLEAMNFLDHLIRQGPADTHRVIRRLFFAENQQPRQLDANIDVFKGFYGSIRLCQSIFEGSSGLGINVDVSNTAFWRPKTLDQVMLHYLAAFDRKYANSDPMRLAQWLLPKRAMSNGQPRYEMSEPFKLLRRFARLKFRVQHRGKTTDTKIYTIKGFCFSPDPNKYGDEGGNPKRVTFVHKQSGRTRSVFDHYYETYNVHLKYWQLPCIESSKGGFFPPESCHLVEMQKYNFKLDPNQTAEMIKFAVTRPPQRRQDIMAAAQRVAWDKDRFLGDFGFKVDCNFAKTKAKLIKNPEIQFGANAKLNPGMTGRWDLRGKKFFKPNSEPLTSWAFVVTDGCVDKQTIENFVRAFKQAYNGHGGKIANDPMLHNLDRGLSQNLVVEQSYKATGNNFRKTPQILFYILPKKDAWIYERLKKSLDCRYGVVSQMLNVSHVRKAAPQYCSNVCMKVNAKLQGATCRIPGPTPSQSAFFKRPTIMIGADVGHPAHGDAQASMAAMTMSMDRDAAIYHAKCETNGHRVEIIQPQTIYSILRPMLQNWSKAMVGAKPEHVFYLRDGVSEGEFAQVMETEVKEIRRNVKEILGSDSKITVIIATKRHHVRFFPEKGDKNGNPLPGTLVEREVTHPFHYDFYLCSHVAIQGTARPVHYHVLHDEVKMDPDELQKMIYHQCYAYQRATTPVSLHPAVYYAHIAGQRARAHEDQASSERMPEREQAQRDPRKIYKDREPYADSSIRKGAETKPLLPLGGGGDAREESKNFIRNTMWFI